MKTLPTLLASLFLTITGACRSAQSAAPAQNATRVALPEIRYYVIGDA